jgi:hypothetical protein
MITFLVLPKVLFKVKNPSLDILPLIQAHQFTVSGNLEQVYIFRVISTGFGDITTKISALEKFLPGHSAGKVFRIIHVYFSKGFA